jgi:hypothetical protein
MQEAAEIYGGSYHIAKITFELLARDNEFP